MNKNISKSDTIHDMNTEVESVGKEEVQNIFADFVALVDKRIEEASVLFENKDYQNVLPKLLTIFEIFTDRSYAWSLVHEIGDDEYMKRSVWLSYRICNCYMELNDYVSAYYYIELVKGYDSDCFFEYINVLVNSPYFNKLFLLEEFTDDPSLLEVLFENEEEKKIILDFLELELGKLYIEYGIYDAARNLYTAHLSNPDTCDIAHKQLEYLVELEKSSVNKDPNGDEEGKKSKCIRYKDEDLTLEEFGIIIHNRMKKSSEILGNEDYERALPELLDIYKALTDPKYAYTLMTEVPEYGYLNTFAWLCSNITLCYIKQDDSMRAFFYIDQVKNHDTTCLFEYVYAISLSGYINALSIMEEYVNDDTELKEIAENEKDFMIIRLIIERKLGELYTQYGFYDKAREIFYTATLGSL